MRALLRRSAGSAPPFDADELLVQPAVEVGEPVGVEAHLLQHGGVQVLDVEAVVDGGRAAEFVGLADADAPLDAAAGHPHGEAVGVVVAARALGVFGGRLAAELAAPDHQRLVEQAAALQILEQAGDRLVGAAGVVGVVLVQVAVGVPVVVVVGAAGIELDEAHAALDQPPGQQAAAAEVCGLRLVDAVELLASRRSRCARSTASGACCCILKASS